MPEGRPRIRRTRFTVVHLLRRVAISLRQRGIAETARQILAVARERVPRTPDEFDLRHDTETGRPARLWKLTVDSANAAFGHRYQPSPPEALTLALDRIPEDFHSFSFVDLGAGKGRMLIVSAGYGFRNLVGVEFAVELIEVARRNILAAGLENAAVLHADAAEFNFPSGNLVVYMYNPFSREVMEPVLGNLTRTLKASHGRVYIVNARPVCADLLESSEQFEVFANLEAGIPVRVWRSRPTVEPCLLGQ